MLIDLEKIAILDRVRTARMSLPELTAAALRRAGAQVLVVWPRVIGQQLTAESELARTPGIRLSN